MVQWGMSYGAMAEGAMRDGAIWNGACGKWKVYPIQGLYKVQTEITVSIKIYQNQILEKHTEALKIEKNTNTPKSKFKYLT